MDDLISRKAAIAELDHAAWGKEYDKALARAMLESLPSTRSEIIRCKDCKYGHAHNPDGSIICEHCDDNAVNDGDFCSRAERRTDE